MNKKQLQSLFGKINYLRRFILNLIGKTHVFSPLLGLKKEHDFKWEKEHDEAFKKVK